MPTLDILLRLLDLGFLRDLLSGLLVSAIIGVTAVLFSGRIRNVVQKRLSKGYLMPDSCIPPIEIEDYASIGNNFHHLSIVNDGSVPLHNFEWFYITYSFQCNTLSVMAITDDNTKVIGNIVARSSISCEYTSSSSYALSTYLILEMSDAAGIGYRTELITNELGGLVKGRTQRISRRLPNKDFTLNSRDEIERFIKRYELNLCVG